MTFENFHTSLEAATPPPGLNAYLESLWFDGKGNWEQAHNIIHDVNDKAAAWIHAYLHRKEGDVWNANYWYTKAGKRMPGYSLDQEWEEITRSILQM